ncbi:MAG: hypothetical protein ACXWCM_18470 [Acidimicrobiales bacterium]
MARRSRSQKGPLWHGYRRPVWRDGVFWLACGASIAGLVVQNAIGNFESTGRGWAILALEVVITFGVMLALVGVLAGTLRGFGEGWRQAEKSAPPRGATAGPSATEPSRPVTEPEPVARAAAVDPEPDPVRPVPDPADRPKAGVEIERQARRLGRAIGAGRRTYKKYDER